MGIIQEIKKFVRTECQKPESRYGYDVFFHHFIPVVRYAKELAIKQGGDLEIILLAAWLHDIGSIMTGHKNHHKTGAKIAGKILKSFGYPAARIKPVQQCILSHRGSQRIERITIEEKVVADADAMSNFDNLPGIFMAAFIYEKLDQGKAKISVRRKFENKWRKLHFDSSREIIRPKYEAIKLLLE